MSVMSWIADDSERVRVARRIIAWIQRSPCIVRWGPLDRKMVNIVQDRFGKIYYASDTPLPCGRVFKLANLVEKYGDQQTLFALVVRKVTAQEMIAAAGGDAAIGRRYCYEIHAD